MKPASVHYSWVILFVATLVVFGALGLARFGYTSVLPAMQADLEMTNAQAGMLATFNLVGYLALAVIGGALAARFGPRVVIGAGLTLAAMGMFLTGAAHGFLPIAMWRALTGIGSGASNVPVMALMPAWFAARRRGLAAGIAAAGSSIGLIVVGPLVPRLLALYGNDGWRTSWFIFGGITLIVAILSGALLRNHPSEKGLTAIGAAQNTPTPAGLDTRATRPPGLDTRATRPPGLDTRATRPPGLGTRATRPPGLGTHATRPPGLQWGRVYRSFAVWHLGLVYVSFGFSYMIYMTFFAKRLIAEGGYTSAEAGGLFMTMGWFSILCGLIWGTVSDVIGRKGALIIVYLIHAVSFTLFGLSTTSAGFTISAILFGLSAWSIPAIMSAACGDMLGPRLAPAALGFITLFFGVGQALGPSVAGAMADAFGTFRPAYLLAAVVALLGAVAAALLRSTSASAQVTSLESPEN